MKSKFQDGKEFLYLGEKYKLKIDNYKTININEGFLCFPQFMSFRIEKELDKWYRDNALEHIAQRVQYYAKRMNVEYLNISIADTKSRWGACTHDNRLQFNWRLIMTPHAVLDSVVVHELAHTLEKNHSRNFWIHVRKVLPGYTAYRQWLNHNGNKLVI
ncbi:MAG TPA: SprT family zinc-dependent metalloprotease [Patescibacteria group bacterium]|nr:SprT family zinc-dependent metalloprotease [Patescibacteria group bacterium]